MCAGAAGSGRCGAVLHAAQPGGVLCPHVRNPCAYDHQQSAAHPGAGDPQHPGTSHYASSVIMIGGLSSSQYSGFGKHARMRFINSQDC